MEQVGGDMWQRGAVWFLVYPAAKNGTIIFLHQTTFFTVHLTGLSGSEKWKENFFTSPYIFYSPPNRSVS
jgi:hypothetical protein